jgi:hypothetical protein
MCMKDKNTVSASADVVVLSHETNYTEDVQLRYNYRAYLTPAERSAAGRALGCVRVVWNDALAHRGAARDAGQKYPTDAEMSARLTASKATPERAWLNEVSSVVLQQSLADLSKAYRAFFDSLSGKRKGAEGGSAPVQVTQGLAAVAAVHRQQPVQDPRQRAAAAAEDRRRQGAVDP